MGSRGLTAVYQGGSYKIAQYGQWDHYPNGQGVVALDFCKKWLGPKNAERESQFLSNLQQCSFVTTEDINKAYDDAGRVKGEFGISMEVVQKFEAIYPLINRSHGAKILELVAEGQNGFKLHNELEFVADSLFCEYAYVIDLDVCTFEVFKGFNHTPLVEGDRFFGHFKAEAHRKEQYQPVKLLAKFDLSNLPSKAVFLETTRNKDDE